MVLLTMNPTIVEALQILDEFENAHSYDEPTQLPSEQQTERDIKEDNPETFSENKVQLNTEDNKTDTEITEENTQNELLVQQDVPIASLEDANLAENAKVSQEPPLKNPKIGNPISHGQIIDLSRKLRKHNLSPLTLELLLRGSRVYVSPPVPKAEPVSYDSRLLMPIQFDIRYKLDQDIHYMVQMAYARSWAIGI